MMLKKLDEDDILEILLEHFQESEYSNCKLARGCILGTPGKDLRFIGAFSNDFDEINTIDFEEIDEQLGFNGDHSFLKSHPEFNLEGKS